MEGDKVDANAKQIVYENTIDALGDKITKNRRDAEEVARQQSTELIKTKGDYASVITRLGIAEREVERQGVELDSAKEEIADLKLKLAKSEERRIAAEQERDKLASEFKKLNPVRDDDKPDPPTTPGPKAPDSAPNEFSKLPKAA